MLNRRHIRIKVLQVLYAFFHSEGKELVAMERELDKSLNETHALYIHMLVLLSNLRSLAEEKIEKGMSKLLPTQEDLNPNKRFVENKVLCLLSENKVLNDKLDSMTIFWDENPEIQSKLFKQILESDLYKSYMQATQTSFIDDKKFVVSLYMEFIAANEDLHSFLEEKSIYWLDDFALVNMAIIKSIKAYKPDSDAYFRISPLYKDAEDKKFAFDLMKKTLLNAAEYKAYIVETASNWDEDRISDMDQLIMQMAICELLNFDTIPVKVSLNEYIELSKDYSSKKSKVFINGVIDKLAIRFKKDGQLKKLGRGLVE